MKLMKAAAVAPLAAAAGLFVAVGPAGPASASSGCVTAGKVTTCTFTFTSGAQTWTVPAGVHSATFTLYGAEGGTAVGGTINSVPVPGAAGGLGAQVTGTLPVTPGTVLQVNVGQAGVGNGAATFGGGGSASGNYSGAGGGASDVRGPAGGYSLADRLLVAGGGGGGGDNLVGPPIDTNFGTGGPGGNADSPGGNGGLVTAGPATLFGGGGGGAGTITAGGSAGAGGTITGTNGCTLVPGVDGAAGTLGAGAAPAFGSNGGAGGGGYYGGGSGGSSADDSCSDVSGPGGGGGGASYTGAAVSASITDGVAAPDDSPNGEVIITFHKGK